MLDMKFVRSNPEIVQEGLLSRGVSIDTINEFLLLEKKYRQTLQEVEELKAKRNQLVPQGKPSVAQREELKELSNLIKKKQELLGTRME